MAPEIQAPLQLLKVATFEDLKKVDIWAFGMVLFNLLNPDLQYPYQLDTKQKFAVKDLVADKKLPTLSTKYKVFQDSIWKPLRMTSTKCLQFESSLRPSATTLKETFQTLLQECFKTKDSGGDCAKKDKDVAGEEKVQTFTGTRLVKVFLKISLIITKAFNFTLKIN